jgi:hypothetical protein
MKKTNKNKRKNTKSFMRFLIHGRVKKTFYILGYTDFLAMKLQCFSTVNLSVPVIVLTSQKQQIRGNKTSQQNIEEAPIFGVNKIECGKRENEAWIGGGCSDAVLLPHKKASRHSAT